MEQFRLDTGGINRAIKVRALTMTPTIFCTMLLGLYVSSLRSGKAIEVFPATVTICCVFILVISIAYFGSLQFRRILESYTLTLEDNTIMREQYNTPILTFPKSDIIEIVQDKKGSYRIKAESWSSIMKIPAQVENADRLHKLLSNIVPVVEKKSHDSVIKQAGLILAGLLTFVLFELSKDKVVVSICGITLIGAWLYSIIQNYRDKNLDYSTKGSLWFKALPLIYFAVSIYKMLMF